MAGTGDMAVPGEAAGMGEFLFITLGTLRIGEVREGTPGDM